MEHTKVDRSIIKKILKPRDQFSHKGDYGHACLITGSIGLMGAAVLAVKACLRSGAGKVTAFTAEIGYDILQISAPEAMTKIAGEKYISSLNEIDKYDSLGIGPGLGIYESHKDLLQQVFSEFKKPIVVDADALNILSQKKELLESLPPGSILTPHVVEFERLFGKVSTDEERTDLALEISEKYNIYIVLKGHHTLIAAPNKDAYFNTTGNAGMATGGTGDVLTGIITGLLAQKYSSQDACLLGVYLHGLAGDIAANKFSQNALIAGDIIENLGYAFKQIEEV
jgi:yjeF C-terminal region, hydroxyethylthiazole kinase-related